MPNPTQEELQKMHVRMDELERKLAEKAEENELLKEFMRRVKDLVAVYGLKLP